MTRPVKRRLAAVGGILLAALAIYAFARPGHLGGRVPPTNRQLTIGITQEFENLCSAWSTGRWSR